MSVKIFLKKICCCVFLLLFCLGSYCLYLRYIKYKNTVIIQLNGGLGNQLYQVVFGMTLKKEYGKVVKYDLIKLKNEKKRIWVKYYLDKFNIDLDTYYNPVERLILTTIFEAENCEKGNYYYNYNPYCFKRKGIYFKGYFENPKYFKKYMPEIINAFTKLNKKYEYELDERNKKIIKEMQSHKNSVVINIRLGDFLKFKSLNLCNFDYYRRAMKVFDKMEDVHYYIFSDDIEGAKKYFKTDKPHTFVDINPLEKPYLNLILSSSGKHNISSNSTFAIWAAMLNSNPNKIVVCPKDFLKAGVYDNAFYISARQIYPDSWIKIDVSKDKPIWLSEIKTKFNDEFFAEELKKK